MADVIDYLRNFVSSMRPKNAMAPNVIPMAADNRSSGRGIGLSILSSCGGGAAGFAGCAVGGSICPPTGMT
jgi:hypothetical protein